MAIVDKTDSGKAKSFLLDSDSDIDSLPTNNIPDGSTAFVIESKKLYMMNSQGEWVLL